MSVTGQLLGTLGTILIHLADGRYSPDRKRNRHRELVTLTKVTVLRQGFEPREVWFRVRALHHHVPLPRHEL